MKCLSYYTYKNFSYYFKYVIVRIIISYFISFSLLKEMRYLLHHLLNILLMVWYNFSTYEFLPVDVGHFIYFAHLFTSLGVPMLMDLHTLIFMVCVFSAFQWYFHADKLFEGMTQQLFPFMYYSVPSIYYIVLLRFIVLIDMVFFGSIQLMYK